MPTFQAPRCDDDFLVEKNYSEEAIRWMQMFQAKVNLHWDSEMRIHEYIYPAIQRIRVRLLHLMQHGRDEMESQVLFDQERCGFSGYRDRN